MIPPEIDYEGDPSVTSWQGLATEACKRIEREMGGMSADEADVSRLEKELFDTKDSGKRVDYPSGMRRDVDTDKPRYDLIPRAMLRRLAELYARGAKKYGDNNWQLANSEEEMQRFQASAFRHFMQWLEGERDEDHGAAVFFNIAAAEHVREKLKAGESVHRLRDAYRL